MSSHVYAAMNQTDEQLFADEQIQRYDADTIKRRYGENWRNYASNMREIKQADGSIVREYIIEDPTFLNDIKPTRNSTSSETTSDDEQQLSKNKFAQIKAKFEKKTLTNVMASPSSSSVASSHTATRQSSHRRDSTDSMNNKNNRNTFNPPPPPPAVSTSNLTQTTNSNSQSSRAYSNTSFRRLNSAEEADEEVQRIHGQGSGFRQQHSNTLTPISSMNETISQAPPPPSNVQYEVVDEDGNPMAIDGVHDLIKMAGVTAREVQQPDGTLVREYVIDDPNILSKFQSQQPRVPQEHIPPPPPRVPLKQSMLFRPEPLSNNQYQAPPINLQQVRTLEPQRRYEFISSSGKRIEFLITSLGSDESDIQELANEVHSRLIPSSSLSSASTAPQQQQQQTTQQFTLPKQWQPAVDLTQRDPSANRSQTTVENPTMPNNYNVAYQQGYNDIARSASLGGGMNSNNSYAQQFEPVFAEPIIDWSAIRQQDPHGQIDPQFIQQLITQKHQTGAFQSSAQFLPEQPPPRNTPSRNASNPPPIYQQQTVAYPYQGAQQHGVRILPQTTTDYNYHQQQIPTGHTRI